MSLSIPRLANNSSPGRSNFATGILTRADSISIRFFHSWLCSCPASSKLRPFQFCATGFFTGDQKIPFRCDFSRLIDDSVPVPPNYSSRRSHFATGCMFHAIWSDTDLICQLQLPDVPILLRVFFLVMATGNFSLGNIALHPYLRGVKQKNFPSTSVQMLAEFSSDPIPPRMWNFNRCAEFNLVTKYSIWTEASSLGYNLLFTLGYLWNFWWDVNRPRM